jgi:hypothetical protein
MKKLLLLLATFTFAFQLYAQVNVNIPDVTESGLSAGDTVSAWITVSDLTGLGIISFQFTITNDPTLVNAVGINTSGDISFSGWTVFPNTSVPGQVQAAGFGAFPLAGSGNFIELIYEVVNPVGFTDLTSTEFLFNAGTPTATVSDGSITLIEPISDPSDLTATAKTENEVDLGWSDNSDNENGFIIERESPTMEAFQVVDSVGPNVNSYTDATVVDGRKYNYQVKAFNDFTQSGYSNTAQTVTLLPAPSSLTGKVHSLPWRVQLDWIDNSDSELGFVISRYDTFSVVFVDIDSVSSNITTYTDTTVDAVFQYIYKTYAFTADTVSDFSDTAWVTVPVELSSLTAELTGNSIDIRWTTATEQNNKGFDLERRTDGEWKKLVFIEGRGTISEETNYQYSDDFNYKSYKGLIEYRLKQIDFSGTYEYSKTVEVNVDFTPKEYVLYQNYPNPFNPSTKIKYALPQNSKVNLTIYNTIGEVVIVLVDEIQSEGFHEVDFNASELTNGIYFYRLVANDNTMVKKMILLK